MLEEHRKLLPMLKQEAGERWNDWKWQYAHRITRAEELAKYLPLTPQQVEKINRATRYYRMAITPYYLSLANPDDPEDPVLRQSLASEEELTFSQVGLEDPLEEKEDSVVPGLVHRYPDRVLMLVTQECAMYCRHCTRKRIWHDDEVPASISDERLAEMIRYLRITPQVREVIVSGGDPLTLPLKRLTHILDALASVPTIEAVRLGTRVPVVMPMRVDLDLCAVLGRYPFLWINTQFDHPNEITEEATAACQAIQRAGIPMSNQSVLLKGINDNVDTMIKLCYGLQRIRVRPYYLFQCDPVTGVEHFRTSVWTGINIIENMRGHVSGLCVPAFVVDVPGGGGKVPLQPQYLVSMSEKGIILRNYEGMFVPYYNPQPQEQAAARPKRRKKSSGVAALSEGGSQQVLTTATSSRLERRKSHKDSVRLQPETALPSLRN